MSAAPPTPPSDPRKVDPAAAARTLEHVPAVVGAELAALVAQMQDIMSEFERTRHMSRVRVAQLKTAIGLARRLAMGSQQLSRLAGGRLRQSHERLGLHDVVYTALKDRVGELNARGAEVLHKLHTIDVIVDPGLLSSLVDAALDWALERGQRVVIRLTMKNWPAHGLLALRASQSVATGQPGEKAPLDDTLSWLLVQETAHAMGVSAEHSHGPDYHQLLLEFPRTVRQLEGLTAVEVETGGESTMMVMGETRSLAGYRVLLISDDRKARDEVEFACESMGLVLDITPTVRQAVRFCELDLPHLVIIDEELHDEQFDELRQDLLRNDINFPFLEIASAANTIAISSWMGDSMTRISRASLREQLPSLLAFELAKIG